MTLLLTNQLLCIDTKLISNELFVKNASAPTSLQAQWDLHNFPRLGRNLLQKQFLNGSRLSISRT